MVNKKKILYEIILDLWDLLKIAQEHECEKLADLEWELFVNKANECTKKYREYGSSFEILFRDLFAVIQKHYEGNGG